MSSGEYIAGRTLVREQSFTCDVVIIGSGASGAVVAAKAVEAGKSVIVLEEGERVTPEEYGSFRPSESLERIWREGGAGAIFGIGDSPVINVTMGRCVGGSSVLTGGVCFRTPEHILDYWVKERGLRDLSPNRMEPYFDEVEEVVSVGEVPVEMRSRSTSIWAEGAERRGYEIKPTKRNTKDCVGHGRCNFGCPKGAKMSVDVSYLASAVDGGATVISDCLVEKIIIKRKKAVGVRGWALDAAGVAREPVTVHAEKVVLAAGAVHSPLVLWNSGVKNRQLGRNMTVHPGFRMAAAFDEQIRGWAGALQSAYCDDFEDRGVTLMSVFVPPLAIAAGIGGIGPDFTKRLYDMDHIAMMGGLVHDDAGGRVWRPRVGREPIITYKMSKADRARIPDVLRLLAEPFIEAGATELYLPIIGHDPVDPDTFRTLDLDRISARKFECSSQHPMGTVRAGTSPKNSVVDDTGKVWGLEGLHVVDGGTVPTSLGVNPQVTIMAMATRYAERILD